MKRDLDASGTVEASESFVYHTDGLGSVTELTDSTGTVVRAYVYDAYGQIVTETGALENPYTFTGREFDAESGLYFYRARYYDARTGRFISEDPVAGLLTIPQTLNPYPYVANNPLNLTDPSGEVACALTAFIGGGINAAVISLAGGSFTEAAAGFGVGALAGGLTCRASVLTQTLGLFTGVVARTTFTTAAGTVATLAAELVFNPCIDRKDLALSTVAGGTGAGIGNVIANKIPTRRGEVVGIFVSGALAALPALKPLFD